MRGSLAVQWSSPAQSITDVRSGGNWTRKSSGPSAGSSSASLMSLCYEEAHQLYQEFALAQSVTGKDDQHEPLWE